MNIIMTMTTITIIMGTIITTIMSTTITTMIMIMIMGIHRSLWQLKSLTGTSMKIIITTIMAMAIIAITVTTMTVKRKRDAHLLRCLGQKAGMAKIPSQR
jgi:energy-coupling factor transporter transmembrane protein EcfT